jgi:hypothetical protein
VAQPATPEQTPSPPARTSSEDTLGLEVASLRSARARLQAGDPSHALRELDAYLARFPHGTLQREQLGLRALALCELGQREAGRALVERIRRDTPGSAQLGRLSLACEGRR